jgi:16S rRNA (cytosine1402-N4)-methyltransferase
MTGHVSVMLQPCLRALNPRPGATIVDCTLGLGGHSEAILEELGSEGRLIGIDRDASMLQLAEQRLERFGSAFRGVHARFSYLGQIVRGAGLAAVDGVLMDLGLCSAHLDDPQRGFSFKPEARDAPLDMRMDRSSGETAAQLIARLAESELVELLRAGDVPSPVRVARAIIAARPIRTVGELRQALGKVRMRQRGHHPATLVFQALRIAVNQELEELQSGLESAVDLLSPRGRLAVLSYHSGEDRQVKRFMAREVKGCICPPELPYCSCGREPRLRFVVRGEKASEQEVRANPRARSARLRAGERT